MRERTESIPTSGCVRHGSQVLGKDVFPGGAEHTAKGRAAGSLGRPVTS